MADSYAKEKAPFLLERQHTEDTLVPPRLHGRGFLRFAKEG